MLIKKLNEEKNIKNVHNHKGSLSSIINEHSKEITDMANKYVKASELYSKVKQWVDEAELTGKNAEYAKKALDKMSRMNLENLVTYLFNIRLKGEDSNLGSYDAQMKKHKYESLENETLPKNVQKLVLSYLKTANSLLRESTIDLDDEMNDEE